MKISFFLSSFFLINILSVTECNSKTFKAKTLILYFLNYINISHHVTGFLQYPMKLYETIILVKEMKKKKINNVILTNYWCHNRLIHRSKISSPNIKDIETRPDQTTLQSSIKIEKD